MSPFYLVSFLTVLLALFHFSDANLDNLRGLRRKCYRDLIPCVMFMNEQRAFGCAQCDGDVRSAPLREFRSLDELILFTTGERERRIVMIPEYIFFSSKVVARLAAAPRNVAAIIVFEGAGDALDVPEEPNGQPVEPIIVRSDDDTEPNRFYNFYNLTELQESCDDSDQQRNPGAFCLKFRFFPFNIFRANATIANEIRLLATRFPNISNENELTVPGAPNSTSPVAPRYKIDSVGQMHACPRQPAPPASPDEASQESAAEAELLVTSEQCLETKTCLPIGGHSLWSSLDHLNRSAPASRNILAITAPMDSIAFFNELALGASAEISSLAVMMAVADAVGKYRRGAGAEDTMRLQPVFFAWNAQSWGYAGSGRFLKDIKEFECVEQADLGNFRPGCLRPYMPSLKFLDFQGATFSVLNVGQMISPNRIDTPISFQFYTHGRKPDDEPGEVEQALIESFSQLPKLRLEAGDEGIFTRYIPLDASQSFRRYMSDVDMITISNHERNFTNKFYHTSFDNQSKTESPAMLRSPMISAATAIASAVIKLSFGATVPAVDIDINRTIIEEAVICLTGNWLRCELGREYLGKFHEARAGSIVPGNYPGSFFPFTRLRDRNPSGAAKLNLIRSFFAYHTRHEVPEPETRCETVRDCEDFINAINTRVSPQSQSQLRSAFCTRGVCVASDTYTHNAFGTALSSTNDAQSSFKYDEGKLKKEFDGADPQEAGWTESVWSSDLGLCGFVEDTPAYGGIILFAGLVVLLVSVVLSLSLDRLMLHEPKESDQDPETVGLQEAPV